MLDTVLGLCYFYYNFPTRDPSNQHIAADIYDKVKLCISVSDVLRLNARPITI